MNRQRFKKYQILLLRLEMGACVKGFLTLITWAKQNFKTLEVKNVLFNMNNSREMSKFFMLLRRTIVSHSSGMPTIIGGMLSMLDSILVRTPV